MPGNQKVLKRGSARFIDVRTFTDMRGSLSVVEADIDLPFVPRRLYYLYGTARGVSRGAHAHLAQMQCMIAISGSVDLTIDDGKQRRTFQLARPNVGLLVRPVVWREIYNISADAVLVVLAADNFSEADYIRDYDAFMTLMNEI